MRFHEAYLVGRLEETKISHQSVCFTRISDFTWRVSDYKNQWELLTGDGVSDLTISVSL